MRKWLLMVGAMWLSAGAQAGADYYTLAVTMSPAFCALNPGKAQSRQCREPRPLSVHGLWPEAARGKSPAYCRRDHPRLSSALSHRLDPLMPDAGLRRYQWQKHGSCSGLEAEAYFQLLAQSYQRLKWPAALTQTRGRDRSLERKRLLADIRAANPGLPERGVYLRCDKKGRPPYLLEVRVCLNQRGEFTECANNFSPNCPVAVTLKAY